MANCTKCGLYNEYQVIGWVCRDCRPECATKEVLPDATPVVTYGWGAAPDGRKVPDLSLAGGVSVAEQLAALDSEILVAVQKLAEPQYNTGNADSYRRALLHNMTILGTRRAMLTANQTDLARARSVLRSLRAAEKEVAEALKPFPKAVQDRLVEQSRETE